MKLLKSAACHLASDGGNVKEMTVMGDAAMDWFSMRMVYGGIMQTMQLITVMQDWQQMNTAGGKLPTEQ